MSSQSISIKLGIICFLVFLDAIGYGVVIPSLPLLAPDVSVLMLGLLFGFYAITSLVSLLPIGWLCDNVGRKSVIIFGTVCYTLASVSFVFADSLTTLFIARGLQGIGGASLWTGALAMISDMMEMGKAGRMTSYVMFSFGLGAILGPGIGTLGSLRFPFVLLTVFGISSILMSLLITDDHRKCVQWKPTVHKEKIVLVLLLNVLIVAIVFGAIEGHIPKFLYIEGLERRIVGVVFMVMGIIHTFVQLPVGVLIDKFGERRVIITGFCVSIGFLLPIPFVGIWWLIVLLICAGATLTMVMTPTTSALGKHAPPSQRGLSMSMYNASWSTGYVLGPLMGGAVIEAMSYPALFYMCASVLLVSAIVFIGEYRNKNGSK